MKIIWKAGEELSNLNFMSNYYNKYVNLLCPGVMLCWTCKEDVADVSHSNRWWTQTKCDGGHAIEL